MKVFISWSADALSLRVAEELRSWLQVMLQSVTPYVSSEDTYKGSRWSEVVARELAETNFGIMCVTSGNANKPWLNFEAGALAKSLESGRVAPLLLDIKASDLSGPMAQFQATNFTYADMYRLVQTINSLTQSPVAEAPLSRGFKAYWDKLKEVVESVIADSTKRHPVASIKRSTEEMLEELLALSRMQQKSMSELSAETRPKKNGSGPRTLRGVDLDDVGYQLAHLRKAAEESVILGIPETSALVRLRGLVQVLVRTLEPALDERFRH
jgi:hypothetical protein